VAVASAGPYASLHLIPDNHANIPHHSVFLQTGCPSCHPTNSVKALKEKNNNNTILKYSAANSQQ